MADVRDVSRQTVKDYQLWLLAQRLRAHDRRQPHAGRAPVL